MRVDILTLFPEIFSSLDASILGKAAQKGLIDINIINIRDFSKDKHKKCDDYPYGGGAGLVMTPQPIYDAVVSIEGYRDAKKIFLSPRGQKYSQSKVVELSKHKHIILLCGHYEGVDQRVIDLLFDEEISIGDYVLTGGEIPAMVVVDSVSRYVPGVLGSEESVLDESFSDNSLEYSQYTRPSEFMGKKVPEVLLSGNHKEIQEFRKKESEKITRHRRPDLLK